jgi:hypothetical protein
VQYASPCTGSMLAVTSRFDAHGSPWLDPGNFLDFDHCSEVFRFLLFEGPQSLFWWSAAPEPELRSVAPETLMARVYINQFFLRRGEIEAAWLFGDLRGPLANVSEIAGDQHRWWSCKRTWSKYEWHLGADGHALAASRTLRGPEFRLRTEDDKITQRGEWNRMHECTALFILNFGQAQYVVGQWASKPSDFFPPRREWIADVVFYSQGQQVLFEKLP